MSSVSFNAIDPVFLFYRLPQSDCLSWWKQQISCSDSHKSRLLLVWFPCSQCRLIWIWACISMSSLESVSCTTVLSFTLPCLTNLIVHSTVFDQTNHPFYRFWSTIQCLLPCLTILSPSLLRFTRYGFVEVWILSCMSELVALLIFPLLLCLPLILTLCNESSWIYCLQFSLAV
jgi:hypothetical protein